MDKSDIESVTDPIFALLDKENNPVSAESLARMLIILSINILKRLDKVDEEIIKIICDDMSDPRIAKLLPPVVKIEGVKH